MSLLLSAEESLDEIKQTERRGFISLSRLFLTREVIGLNRYNSSCLTGQEGGRAREPRRTSASTLNG
jgi:hypothetical protein